MGSAVTNPIVVFYRPTFSQRVSDALSMVDSLMELVLDVRLQFNNHQNAKFLTCLSQVRQIYVSLLAHVYGGHGFRSSSPNP